MSIANKRKEKKEMDFTGSCLILRMQITCVHISSCHTQFGSCASSPLQKLPFSTSHFYQISCWLFTYILEASQNWHTLIENPLFFLHHNFVVAKQSWKLCRYQLSSNLFCLHYLKPEFIYLFIFGHFQISPIFIKIFSFLYTYHNIISNYYY